MFAVNIGRITLSTSLRTFVSLDDQICSDSFVSYSNRFFAICYITCRKD